MPLPASLLDIRLEPGKPPLLAAPSGDPLSWAAEHRRALRAALVRIRATQGRNAPGAGLSCS